MKVMVVDDDVVARMMLMHLIDACGAYEIVEAEDGEQAWHYLQQEQEQQRPALVFCDLRMPRLSGLELLQRVRANAQLASLPLVLVSAANDAATRDEAMALGANGFIVKPLHDHSVREQLTQIVSCLEEGDDSLDQAAARLGIDHARLRVYLTALGHQLSAAQQELPLADERTRAERLERLRVGCATLGLHGSAKALAALLEQPATRAQSLLAALGALAQTVARRLG